MPLSKCAVCNSKDSKFIEQKEASGFLSSLGIRQPGFTYSVCGTFTKSKERMQKFKETGDLQQIYQNKLDKVCFKHDMTSRDFKDFTRATAYDKILHDKAFNNAKNPKDDSYQRGLTSIVWKFVDKIAFVGVIINEIMSKRIR